MIGDVFLRRMHWIDCWVISMSCPYLCVFFFTHRERTHHHFLNKEYRWYGFSKKKCAHIKTTISKESFSDIIHVNQRCWRRDTRVTVNELSLSFELAWSLTKKLPYKHFSSHMLSISTSISQEVRSRICRIPLLTRYHFLVSFRSGRWNCNYCIRNFTSLR